MTKTLNKTAKVVKTAKAASPRNTHKTPAKSNKIDKAKEVVEQKIEEVLEDVTGVDVNLEDKKFKGLRNILIAAGIIVAIVIVVGFFF